LEEVAKVRDLPLLILNFLTDFPNSLDQNQYEVEMYFQHLVKGNLKSKTNLTRNHQRNEFQGGQRKNNFEKRYETVIRREIKLKRRNIKSHMVKD